MLRIGDYAELRLIAWQHGEDQQISEQEALSFYESNWRFVDRSRMTPTELALLDELTRTWGNGVLNV